MIGPEIPAELLASAEGVDAELAGAAAAPGSPSSPPPPAIPLEVEIAGIFELAGVGAGQFLPTVGATLDAAACKKLGDALAPVVRKYGLERYLTGFAWRVELQALLVCVPIVAAVIAAARADIAIARARARGEQIGAAVAAAVKTENAASSPEASAPSSTPPPPAAAPVKAYTPPPGALKPLSPEELEASYHARAVEAAGVATAALAA